MLSPEELGQDASVKDPTRGDDIPGRAHQKICEVRPPRQAAYHAVGERGPPDAHPDESLEQPLPGEFATARLHVWDKHRRGKRLPVRSSPLSRRERGTGGEDKRGDQTLGRELRAAKRAVDSLTGERVEEVRRIADQKGSPARRDGGARPLRERTCGQHVANQTP